MTLVTVVSPREAAIIPATPMRDCAVEESFRSCLRDALARELSPQVKEILALLGFHIGEQECSEPSPAKE